MTKPTDTVQDKIPIDAIQRARRRHRLGDGSKRRLERRVTTPYECYRSLGGLARKPTDTQAKLPRRFSTLRASVGRSVTPAPLAVICASVERLVARTANSSAPALEQNGEYLVAEAMAVIQQKERFALEVLVANASPPPP